MPDTAPTLPDDVQAELEHYIALAGDGESRPVDAVLRGLDVLISAAFLLVLSPLLALTALAIILTSGRPLFYHGARVGSGG
ncbi:MAG TPA: sugar transferase, partial [Solirubrobacterales bacterium]